jgi:hypothetical protein
VSGAGRPPAPTPLAERAAPEVAADREPAATARPTGPATPAKPAQPAKPAATAVIDKPAPSPGASSLNDLLAKKRERRTPKSD